MAARPEIYGYLALRPFLRDWLGAWEGELKRNTRRKLADETGLALGTLENILAGRRVPQPPTLRRLNRALALDAARLDYLARLTTLERSKGTEARRQALDAVLTHPGALAWHRTVPADLRYLERWGNVALREVARLAPLSADVETIRRRLALPLDDDAIRRSIETLVDLGMLRREPDGSLVAVDGAVEAGPTVEGARAFHGQMLSVAIQALDAIPHEERFFCSLTLALPPGAWKEFARGLWDLLVDVRDRWERSSGAQRVVQVNVQAFPFGFGAEEANPLKGDRVFDS